MYKIRTFNQISEVGLSRFPLESYEIGPDFEEPDAIVLRSHKLHDEIIPSSVLAVARAGGFLRSADLEKIPGLMTLIIKASRRG